MAVKPGDDFFRYADGAWLAKTTIPADKTSFGAFDILADRSEAQVHAILEAAAAKGGSTATAEGKIGAAYRAFMDEATIEKR
ncbi:peptidase M13, partial [Mycobacterium tuberculosis]